MCASKPANRESGYAANMIKTTKLKNGAVHLKTSRYRLEICLHDTLIYLEIKGTHQKYLFFPGGACNPTGKRDETNEFETVRVISKKDHAVLTFGEQSILWKNKRHTWICRENSVEVFYDLQGRGEIERAHYFRGYFNGSERGMGGEIDEIFSTCPNFQEKLFFHPGESFTIAAGNNLELPVGAQALASPCYCLGLHDRRDKAFWSVGLAATPGKYTWDSLQWNPPALIPPTAYKGDSVIGGGFAAVYDGKLKVDGAWQSPRLIMTFARDRYDVLRQYLEYCYRYGYLRRPSRRKPADWWREPIYCTWHDQTARATLSKNDPLLLNAFDFCTQKFTDRWVRLLEKNHCRPGTVILDATWAVNLNSGEPDPKKWPDMRGWIERCHQRKIRVFVWNCAWTIEGIPPDECMTRDGKPVVCDITNPKYLRRFREMVRRWFSDAPDCLNADGVKVDGQLGLPTGPRLSNHGGIWGLELQRFYLKTLSEEARKHKPDVCISAFTLNPLLAEYVDMVRIADMYTTRLTAHETMLHRAKLYRVSLPKTIIDTDGQFAHYILNDYNRELAEQAKIGIPCLYAAELVYRNRYFLPTRVTNMTKNDYRVFAKVFADYRSKIKGEAT